jgi:hypothetical protein
MGARRAWEEEFVAYYAAKGDMLRKTAYALCGDWHLAERAPGAAASVPRPVAGIYPAVRAARLSPTEALP